MKEKWNGAVADLINVNKVGAGLKTALLKAVIGGLILGLIDIGIAPQGI